MRRLVGTSLKPVSLPPDGVVLTKKLGELLGVAPSFAIALTVSALRSETTI